MKALKLGFATMFVTLFALFGLRFVSFTNNIELMLPRQDEITRSFRFFRESNVADKVLLSFELTDDAHSTQDLIAAVDRFASKLDSPLISAVTVGVNLEELGDLQPFLKAAPQLTGVFALQEIEDKITPESIKTLLAGHYRTFLSPASMMMTPLIRQDPLGIWDKTFRELSGILKSSPFEVQVRDGHFISKDGRHALVILETPVAVTDGFGAKDLMAFLSQHLQALPAFVRADVIAGHAHSISNEAIIKRDIFVTVTVVSAAFLGMFLFLFRDAKALFLFMIPLVSVVMAIHIGAVFFGELSYMIMGMGAVVSGIAIDYGIHVYVAMRTGKGSLGAVNEVKKPIVIGALTTVGVFSVFFLSRVRGYQELAFFTITSILFCLGYSLYVLPHLLCSAKEVSSRDLLPSKTMSFKHSDGALIGVWGVAVLFALLLLPQVHFRSDVRQFDGSAPQIFEAEARFHDVWGGKDRPAVLVAEARNFDEALRLNEQLYADVSRKGGEGVLTSLAPVWPSRQTREANVREWNRFWTSGNETKLRSLLREYGAGYDFSASIFDPFFQTLFVAQAEIDAFGQQSILRSLLRRFRIQKETGVQVLSFFPDESPHLELMREITGQRPGSFVVSTKSFKALLSETILSEVFYLALFITLILPLLAFWLFRNFRLVAIALVPVVTSVLAILGVVAAMGWSLNAASVIAVLIVGGLSIDYGIFMVYHCHHHLKTNTQMAVSLSALTTLFGAGALLFAKHPVLLSYGITMVTGVLGGYLSAIGVVPALYRLSVRSKLEIRTYETA